MGWEEFSSTEGGRGFRRLAKAGGRFYERILTSACAILMCGYLRRVFVGIR
jgi:hypothetical protein